MIGVFNALGMIASAQRGLAVDGSRIADVSANLAGIEDRESELGPAGNSKPPAWNFHFQNTDILQGDLPFQAKYSGPNSLDAKGEAQNTETLDAYIGRRLWKGAEAHVDGLVWRGFGLSQTFGVEAFPSGEAYKYGTATPYFMLARAFVRQVWGLGVPQEDVPDTELTLAGKQDVKRITLTVGRFTPTDVIDTNAYANSARTQFMNWGLINNLTWDYPADAVGFDSGLTAELNQPTWTLRYSYFLMPTIPNTFTGEDQFLMWPHEGSTGPIFKDWGMNLELEQRYSLRGHPGAIRYQAWLNEANMATYSDAAAILRAGGPNADWEAARSFRYKHGFGLNWEQELSKTVGLFSRAGFNDGREEGWAFTDVTWTASFGASVKGDAWKRSGDTLGIGGIVSGASSQEQAFLQAGGTGILAGDGALTYAPEEAVETYYDTRLFRDARVAFDYQLAVNPAFNTARGPVSVFGVRLHYEF